MQTDLLCACCEATFANIDSAYCAACLDWLKSTFSQLRADVIHGLCTDFPSIEKTFMRTRALNHMFMQTGRMLKIP